MVDIVQIVFMIPISLRERLCIEPGTTLKYEEFESGGRKRVRINLIQKKRLPFQDIYRVSENGQITIPKHVLAYLGIQNKDELDIELYGNDLTLIRGYLFQFKEIIESKRKGFFTNSSLDLLSVVFHQEPDQENERTLFVDNATFLELRHLYFKIKSKFDPNNPNWWVLIPENPAGSFKDKGISIHYSTESETLIIQKFSFEFLPDQVAYLCRERIPFTIHKSTITYGNDNYQHVEELPLSSEKIAAIFHRYGHEFGDYFSENGYTVSTVKLYTDDLVVIEQRDSVIVRFWPANKNIGKKI
ncbi:AbrB/MazE/SpoVT family DNA-binding domain-containing protein [Paenibacillus donghaensis]|uniref:AbrB/MazE/SpoVT family DNA-binding domain-containing protein n=1 Tax=Paenibacillus donghaensis TaxID=414771 RepID=UPI001883527A|nr:AbrB/MazE/SpoVT family DNA-binding domain-containing protein [Paenibacillus donghaensis]MBE9914152.1 AbrB/MazE/SpoVT family DNA-binding domain-containing protein [Paenibacillus donghaensis]